MKYCDKCGCKLPGNANFCPNCGKSFNDYDDDEETSDSAVIICAIVGLLLPLVGAILYYVFKNSKPRAAKMANRCSWIGFLIAFCLWFITRFYFRIAV